MAKQFNRLNLSFLKTVATLTPVNNYGILLALTFKN